MLEEAPTCSTRITGAPTGPDGAASVFAALPQGKAHGDKFLFGIYCGDQLIGCADVIRGYPNPTTAILGLLLISEKHQRQGVGRRAYAMIGQLIRDWGTCDTIRGGVIRTNAEVIPFWESLGFEPTGEVAPYHYGPVRSENVILRRRL